MGGFVGILLGIGLAAVGVYGLAVGIDIEFSFTINENVVTVREDGHIFLIIGIVVLLIGIVLTYMYREYTVFP